MGDQSVGSAAKQSKAQKVKEVKVNASSEKGAPQESSKESSEESGEEGGEEGGEEDSEESRPETRSEKETREEKSRTQKIGPFPQQRLGRGTYPIPPVRGEHYFRQLSTTRPHFIKVWPFFYLIDRI